MDNKKRGFTFIEMAVVLLIIALLAGGITVGRTLLRNAKLQTVVKEYTLYLQAIGEFKEKYNSLPGDFTDATAMWGTDGACPNTTYIAAPLTSSITCNGDGNGHVGDSTNAGAVSDYDEWWRFWHHLSLAYLIDGRYTGRTGTNGATHAVPGLNVPNSEFIPGGWSLIFYQLTTADGGNWYRETTDGGYGHILVFGAQTTTSYTYSGIMQPSDALDIDSKFDDGKPGLGKIRTLRNGVALPNCTTNDTSQSNQTYNTTIKSDTCSLIFLTGM